MGKIIQFIRNDRLYLKFFYCLWLKIFFTLTLFGFSGFIFVPLTNKTLYEERLPTIDTAE